MSGITSQDIEEISLGIIIGVGFLVVLLVKLALLDRKRQDDARKDEGKKDGPS